MFGTNFRFPNNDVTKRTDSGEPASLWGETLYSGRVQWGISISCSSRFRRRMSSVETNESKTASEREGEQWACLPVSCSVILHKNLIYCSSSIAIENQYEGQNFTVYLFLIVLLIPACLPPTVITVLPTKYIADWRWLLIWLKNQVVVVVSGTAHGAPGVGRLPVLLSVRTHVQPGLAAPV